ncbi:carbohydrate esterase family 4 protein, partial [Schizopora paradoxa]
TGIPPLSSITTGDPAPASFTLSTTYQAGATPPISGAPSLPTCSYLILFAADWPALDQNPPTNSSEVEEWMTELDGFDIPDLDPTVDGSCAGDPEAAADAANRGWWTCGGYTRDTDITSCPDKLTWGMSFDDGPSPNSPTLLKFLSDNHLTSTFFVVGSRVISYPDILRDEYMSGHEISVHTWSHPPLTKLTNEQIVAELGWTRKAVQDVLGITPTTMRPPYGDIDDRVRAISLAMGLVPIIWTRDKEGNQFDTNDWKVPGGVVTAEQSVQAFDDILSNATTLDTGFIVLEHDLFPQEVDLGVGYFLESALKFTPRLTMKPIGACQNWPESNMYLETTTNTTFPYPDSNAVKHASAVASARATATAKSTGSSSGSSN